MVVLLELKERMKSFYGKYAAVVDGAVRFFFGFFALTLLNANIGYMAVLKNPVAVLLFSVICAFIPYSGISFLLGILMLVHIYAVSPEIALVTVIFLVCLMLLYYGFKPGDSYWLVLTPMAFLLRIPFVIPLLAGLSGSLVTAVPVSCGVVVYYILMYVKQNAGVLANDASVDITQKFVQIIHTMFSNRLMFVMLLTCLVGILVVYLIRTLSVDYAWILAIVIGMISQMVAVFVGDYLFDVTVSIMELIVGVFAAMLIAGVYHFFVFAVDYSRTEYTQFEDDDYVYYVKAVPKVVVAKPDPKVQRINNPARTRRNVREKNGQTAGRPQK